MKKFSVNVILVLTISLGIGLTACKKNNDSNTSTLQVRLTDGPTNLQEVNIDIKQVNVKFDDDSSNVSDGWISLQTNARVYNILRLQNGVDTLLAVAPLQTGIVKQIRFVLGSNNTVKDSLGVIYPLTIPSGSESGLKIKISKNLNLNLETLIIDFDADLSIKLENGQYKLRPVLRVK